MPRPATEIIDQAIEDNRWGEYLLYRLAICFVAIGVALILWSVFVTKVSFVAISGVIESVLFVPAVYLARQTRRENMMIRMLEVPLSQANTADEAAKIITETFKDIFSEKPKKQGRRHP